MIEEISDKKLIEFEKPHFTKRPLTWPQAALIAFFVLMIAGAFWMFKPAPQWQYSIVSIPDDSFATSMNKYGGEGWEIVSARRASDGKEYNPTFSYEIIFKRPK